MSSFQEWYNPTRDDPEGPSAAEAGMQKGGEIGSMFGASGFIIGAGIGGVIGGSQGSGARDRARRRAMRASYKFAGNLFQYGKESRLMTIEQYEGDVSALSARVASSGGSTPRSFDILHGQLVTERDEALAAISAEVQSFREGENYKYFLKDYDRLGHAGGGIAHIDQPGPTQMWVGWKRTGETGVAMYDPAHRAQMIYVDTSNPTQGSFRWQHEKAFQKYATLIKPSVAMYEKKVFGDKEDKAEYDEYISARIEAANKWYIAEIAKLNKKFSTQADYKETQILYGDPGFAK